MQLGVPSNIFIDPWKEVIPMRALGETAAKRTMGLVLSATSTKDNALYSTTVPSVHASFPSPNQT